MARKSRRRNKNHRHHPPEPVRPAAKPAPRSKSSRVVTFTILGTVSALVLGYCAVSSNADDVTADCVDLTQRMDDGSYVVVDDDYCDDDSSSRVYVSGSHRAYHWYYGGTRRGNVVRGGTTARPQDVNISSRSGREIQRGGFGSGRTSGG